MCVGLESNCCRSLLHCLHGIFNLMDTPLHHKHTNLSSQVYYNLVIKRPNSNSFNKQDWSCQTVEYDSGL